MAAQQPGALEPTTISVVVNVADKLLKGDFSLAGQAQIIFASVVSFESLVGDGNFYIVSFFKLFDKFRTGIVAPVENIQLPGSLSLHRCKCKSPCHKCFRRFVNIISSSDGYAHPLFFSDYNSTIYFISINMAIDGPFFMVAPVFTMQKNLTDYKNL